VNVKSLVGIAIGLVVFVVADELIENLITGTDTGSVLIQSVLLLVVGVAIIIGVLKALA